MRVLHRDPDEGRTRGQRVVSGTGSVVVVEHREQTTFPSLVVSHDDEIDVEFDPRD